MKRLTRNPVIRAVALLGALLLPAVRWAPPAAAQTADAVVEVIIEVMDIKKSVLRELDGIAPPHCLFFSNTSGLSLTEIASATKRPERFIGTHFFNPVPVMKLPKSVV